jgi:hypothetical protein
MPLSQENLERQLARADEALADCVKNLDERGVAETERRRDPQWRSLRAKRRQLQARLRRVTAVAALNDELARRSEKTASGDE